MRKKLNHLFCISKYFSSWESRPFYHDNFHSKLSSSLYFPEHSKRSRVFGYQLVDGIFSHNIYLALAFKWTSIKYYFEILKIYFICRFCNHSDKIKRLWFTIKESDFLVSNRCKNAIFVINKLHSFIYITHKPPRIFFFFFPFFPFKTNIINFGHLCCYYRIDRYNLRKRVRSIQNVCNSFFCYKLLHPFYASKTSNTKIFYRRVDVLSYSSIGKNYINTSFLQLFCYNYCFSSSSNYKNF